MNKKLLCSNRVHDHVRPKPDIQEVDIYIKVLSSLVGLSLISLMNHTKEHVSKEVHYQVWSTGNKYVGDITTNF